MNKYATSHPDTESLLRYSDGELKNRDAAQVRAHLEACWRCRAEVQDLQETITEYVGYERAILESPPAPPAPWDGFERHLDRLIAERHSRPRPHVFTLAAAVAAVLAVAVMVVELRHPASVSAAELLRKAAEKETVAVSHPRRTRITARGHSFVRGSGGPLEEQFQAMFAEARYSWEDPLSARAFQAWRDGLAERRDEVTLQDGIYEVRTSTHSSSLGEARLSLRAVDLGVIRGWFRFNGDDMVEMTALADEPSSLTQATAPPMRKAPNPPPAGPAEELHVLVALHSAGADRGEQVTLKRDGAGRLIVSGVGIEASRRAAIESALAAVPGVSVRFEDPRLDLSQPSEAESTAGKSSTPELRSALGGPAGLSAFTEQALEFSGNALVQAHDLRQLAEEFPPGVEQRLAPDDRTLLTSLRREHAETLAETIAGLDHLLTPVLSSLGAPPSAGAAPPESANWQDATQSVFTAVQQLDKMMTSLITGGATFAPDTNRALQQLKADIGWFERY